MSGARPEQYEHGQVIESLTAQLRRGIDVEVVGMRGSGRSTLLDQLGTRLADDGWHVLTLRAVPGDRNAIGRAIDRMQRGANLPRTIPRASVLDVVGARQAAILIDDADALDESEWLELRLVRLERLVPVVSVHDREDLRPRRGRDLLGRSALVAGLAMPDLGFAELRRVLETRFGSSLHDDLARRVFSKSGGHIGTAVAMIELGLATGTIDPSLTAPVRPGRLWRQSLGGVTDRHLAHSTPDEIAALSALALAGTIDARAAARIASIDTLSRLEQRGLIQGYNRSAAPWISLHPPLLIERFRDVSHGIQAFAARETLRAASLPVATAAPRPRAGWQTVSDPVLPRLIAERRSNELAMAEADWDEHPSLETALALLDALNRALADRRRVAEMLDIAEQLAEQRAEGLAETSGASAERSRAAVRIWRARWIAHVEGRLERALALLDDATGLGDYARLLDAARAELCTSFDRIPSGAVEQLADDPALPDEVRAELAVVRAEISLWSGRGDEAITILDDLPVALTSEQAHRADLTRGYVDFGRGLHEAADQRVETGLRRARDELDSQALTDYLHLGALMLFGQGRQGTLQVLAENLRATSAPAHFPQTSYLAVLSLTAASDLAPREFADGLEELARAGRAPTGPLPGASLNWPRAHLLLEAGDDVAAAALMWDAAIDAQARGFVVGAGLSALASLEVSFDVERFAALADAVAVMQSPAIQLWAEYVRLRAAGTGVELMHAADALAEYGWTGRAISAYALAVRRARAEGDVALEDAARRAGEALSSDEPDEWHAMLIGSAAVRLSSRERAIADLVADGLSNAEIAARLVLSVRTVENHIYRALRNVGALSRAQLGAIARAYRQ